MKKDEKDRCRRRSVVGGYEDKKDRNPVLRSVA